jgi:hypothetical protein
VYNQLDKPGLRRASLDLGRSLAPVVHAPRLTSSINGVYQSVVGGSVVEDKEESMSSNSTAGAYSVWQQHFPYLVAPIGLFAIAGGVVGMEEDAPGILWVTDLALGIALLIMSGLVALARWLDDDTEFSESA